MKVLCIISFCLFLVGCTTTLPNGCLIDASSYKYSFLAKEKLPQQYAHILIVQYDGTMGHAFCIYTINGKDLWSYDHNLGSIRCPNKDPFKIAIYLTRIYNLIYNSNLVVSKAYFLPD